MIYLYFFETTVVYLYHRQTVFMAVFFYVKIGLYQGAPGTGNDHKKPIRKDIKQMENTNNQTMPETIAALNRAIAYLRTCAVNTTDILTGDIVNAVTEELDIVAANLEREQNNQEPARTPDF